MRTSVLGRTQADVTSGNACWETPPAVFQALNDEFHFDIDLCADMRRALCPTWFGPGSQWHTNALEAPWAMFGRTGYANPPYGRFVPHILRRAREATDYGFTSVLLLPMRVTKAFVSFVLDGAAELRFCDKRLTFYEHGAPRLNPRTGRPDPAPFDSILVVYRPGVYRSPAVSVWSVPPHVSKGTPVHDETTPQRNPAAEAAA